MTEPPASPEVEVLLVVEDDPDDEVLTLRALRKGGLVGEIAVARDGVEALEHLARRADEAGGRLPRLMLLDLNLPRVDGFEVLARVRASAPLRRMPIVVLSASREPADIERCYALGANAYVRKPVDYLAFLEVARRIVAFWLELNETTERPAAP